MSWENKKYIDCEIISKRHVLHYWLCFVHLFPTELCNQWVLSMLVYEVLIGPCVASFVWSFCGDIFLGLERVGILFKPRNSIRLHFISFGTRYLVQYPTTGSVNWQTMPAYPLWFQNSMQPSNPKAVTSNTCETNYLDHLLQFPLLPSQCAVEGGRVQSVECEGSGVLSGECNV